MTVLYLLMKAVQVKIFIISIKNNNELAKHKRGNINKSK